MSALGLVIHPNQTCDVPDRIFSEKLALLRILSTIIYMQERGVDACLISLDQEKTFDMVAHTYMWDIVSKMDFGEEICNWIRLLYTNIVSVVSINGKESESFPITSGIRQGCPLSPALFVCYIEPFAESIRKDVSLRGVTIPGSRGLQAKDSLCIDDIAIFCSDLPSVCRLMASATSSNWLQEPRTFQKVPQHHLAVDENGTTYKILSVCQSKGLTLTECCSLAHSKVQDYMLRVVLKLGEANAKVQY
eukprot:g48365.t1